MTPAATDNRRAYWLRTLHEWHWVSSALCLIGMGTVQRHRIHRNIVKLRARLGESEETVALTDHYHNLLRWSEV
jgi:predicted 2-oxoglutarate/Fe(II)-dependent dioxygenase YbiX